MCANFADKHRSSQNKPAYLLLTEKTSGELWYYFIRCSPLNLELIKRNPREEVNIAQYAEILYQGSGHEPSEAHWNAMKEFDFYRENGPQR